MITKKAESPTARTQAFLRKRGVLVAKTEHWNHYAKCTQDLFGFVDTVALDPTTYDDFLCIQSTTDSHHSARVKKILANENLATILRHARVEVWSWAQRGKRKLWTVRREGFQLHPDNTCTSFTCRDPIYL